jgi:hypothetical protein
MVVANLTLGATLLHLGATTAQAADPLGEILDESNFNDGSFDGWSRAASGVKGTDANWGTVHTIDWPGGHVQVIQLDGVGGRNHPNSWIFREFALPETARTLTFDTAGHDRAGADAELKVRVVENGTSVTLLDEVEHGCAGCTTLHGRSLDISPWAGKTVTFYFEQNDNGSNGQFPGVNEQVLLDNIRIRGALPPCDLAGTVRDGQLAGDGHANPLAGVPVTLFQDGNPVVGPLVTDADGHYCIPGGVIEPGDYRLEVALFDAKDNPPVFKTVHGASDEPVTTSLAVTGEDIGREDFDVTFAATAAQPWLADVAAIHWESARYVTWLTGTLGLGALQLAGLTVETDSAQGTSYSPSLKRAYLQVSDTRYTQRQYGTSECPENCEWHEISHHVATVLGIAPTDTAPACTGRVAHGGWANATTCDSLAEGFAIFLPTLASFDIDAGRGPNYATTAYSVFGSMEDDRFRPWDDFSGTHREDFAVAQLLWDLADDSPNETLTVRNTGPVRPGADRITHPKDRVALGARLVFDLAFIEPTTVADVYDGLLDHPNVPAADKTADLDLDGDGIVDISPIDEVFLSHGFHPVGASPNWDTYLVGDPISQTQPGSSRLAVRRNEAITPGSAIRLTNRTTAPVTMAVDVAYPATSLHFEVVVEPEADRLVQLELPPYWDPGDNGVAALPACTAADPWPVTVTISAPGATPTTTSSCNYLHAAASTTTGAALTFSVEPAAAPSAATAPPTPAPAQGGAATSLAPIAAIAAVLIVAAVAFLVWFRRRRPAPKG